MLKHHDLYGQSFVHEFRFANPDSIKDAVRRYNVQRAAERDESRREREAHKTSMPRFCKMRNSGHDVLGMVTCRDHDIETQMSQQLSDCTSCSEQNEPEYPQEQRLAGGADTSQTSPRPKRKVRSRKPKRSQTKPTKKPDPRAYEACIEELHREVCAELKLMEASQSPPSKPDSSKTKRKMKPQQRNNQKQRSVSPKLQKKKQPITKPKNQETKTPPKPDLMHQRLKEELTQGPNQVSFEDFSQPQTQWLNMPQMLPQMLPQMVPQMISQMLPQVMPQGLMLMEEPGCSGEPAQNASMPYRDAVDSDLEQEYVDRPGYMRYIEQLPFNHSEASVTHNIQNPSFVQLDPHPHWISLQRSLKPMDYTSQRSDTDSCTLCEQSEQDREQEREPEQQKSKPAIPAPPAAQQQKAPPAKLTKNRKPAQVKRQVRQQAGRDKEQEPQDERPIPVPVVTLPKRRKNRNVVCTRSLENLKFQKITIYNKITMTQERLITALDRLQISLLELPMRYNTASHQQDTEKRKKNAFNFCVTFSRNYLYPLRGMIEDVHYTPVASFNSATSNEASQRVVCVYALMHHSLGRYQRHIRYFLLPKVPQKLSALIEMMYKLTNVCLQKGVLDRQDPVVECLQQRCTSFISFIEDMQEQRFQVARDSYRRQTHSDGQHNRYDLKMCLNDLKLYEPRLVPKERTEKRRCRGGWIRKPKLSIAPNNAQSQVGLPGSQQSEMHLDQTNMKEVPTHIECIQCGEYRSEADDPDQEPSDNEKYQVSNILELLQKPGRENRDLHQQLLEAMEHVTKSQVREVLDPLVRSLGLMLDKKIHFNQEYQA